MLGACFGFLWWNAPPAKIFMGDTGSLALGGALAGLAICTKTQLLLAILGGLFVIITMSDVIQVTGFKVTKIRTGRNGCSRWRRCSTTSRCSAGRRRRS